MESQIKISLKIPGPCRIPTDGPRGRGSVPPPWVSAGNIKSGAELSLNTALHFSMRTHGQTPILRLAMERKDGYNRPVVQSLDCCAEWYRHSYRAAGCASTLRPAAVYVSMPILPHCLWNCKGLFRPAETAPAELTSGGGGLLCPCFTVPAPRAPPRGAARPPVRCSPPPRYWWAPVRAELPPDNTPPAHPVQRTDRATENIPP